MALANIFPGNYYSGDEAKALDFMGYFDNQRQQQEALQNNEINRTIALDDLFRTQEKHPYEVTGLDLGNQMKALDITAKGLKNKNDQRDLDVRESIPLEDERRATVAKLAKQFTADELASEEAQINKWLLNPHLTPQQRQTFEFLRSQIKDVYKAQQQIDSREEIAAMRREAETERLRAITEREAEKERRKKADKESLDNMFEQINKKTTAAGKMAQIRTYLGLLSNDDPRRMALLRAEAELLPQYNAEANQRSAGKSEWDAATGTFGPPKGTTLAPRNPEANKPDPLGIR